jgi:hypothetical protein
MHLLDTQNDLVPTERKNHKQWDQQTEWDKKLVAKRTYIKYTFAAVETTWIRPGVQELRLYL